MLPEIPNMAVQGSLDPPKRGRQLHFGSIAGEVWWGRRFRLPGPWHVRLPQKIASFSSAGRLRVPDLTPLGDTAAESGFRGAPHRWSCLRGSRPRHGPVRCRSAVAPNPYIANLVAEAILIGQGERRFYELCAWVVMPNHVHLLILPQVPIAVLMRWLKGSTSRSANRILGRTGQPFWQDESFDHYLRGSKQTGRIAAYIEGNPVSAGLARSAECWPWSSAGWQAKPPAPPNLPDDRAKM